MKDLCREIISTPNPLVTLKFRHQRSGGLHEGGQDKNERCQRPHGRNSIQGMVMVASTV
jgi:hypothetical protein